MWLRRVGVPGVAAVALAVLVAGCASSGSAEPGAGGGPRAGGGSSASPATVNVVASTDVYGSIVKQVAGDVAGTRVQITSIITDPDADPHSYEASTQNQLALSKADVVIENGGGYDEFIDTMLDAAHNSSATVLNVVDISGKSAPAGGELNEHVWYDLPTVGRLADRIAAALAADDAADAETFRANAAAFTRQLTRLEAREASIRAAHAGEGVAITEPVPLYLLEACGLDNKTPEAFSEAVEEGTDVPPTVLRQTLELFTGGQVALLAYNEQTSGPQTERVLNTARDHHIPVVPVTETLPEGTDYLSWMRGNLTAIQSALG